MQDSRLSNFISGDPVLVQTTVALGEVYPVANVYFCEICQNKSVPERRGREDLLVTYKMFSLIKISEVLWKMGAAAHGCCMLAIHHHFGSFQNAFALKT